MPTKRLTRLLNHWNRFWFAPVTSDGFGLMRIAFGICTFITFILQWGNVTFYYSRDGMFPPALVPVMLRHSDRFSLLDWFNSPVAVEILYFVLLLSLLFVTIGLFTRLSLLLSTIIIFSFHEYATILLDGGDTMIRLIAFILLLSPCHRSFSFWNLERRYHRWKTSGTDQPVAERTMGIWAYRLLLWQMVCLYVSSAAEKWLGDMWHDGTAVGSVLLHPHFSRMSPTIVHRLVEPLSPILTYFTVGIQALWILLIIFPLISWLIPPTARIIDRIPLKRTLLISGVLLHGGIAIFMDVGIFSFIMMTTYLGLLLDEDFEALCSFFNKWHRGTVTVLYDGHCRLCRRSVFGLMVLDWLHRLSFVDFHDEAKRKKVAPTVALSALQHAMHVKLPNGEYTKGFYAFRTLTWHLPALWIIAPFLSIPGIDAIGVFVYEKIARNRLTCSEGTCKI